VHPHENVKQRILLVVDAEDLQPAHKRLLSERYQLVEARDGECALTIAREQGPFPVVIAKQRASGTSGIALLRALRAQHPSCVGMLRTAGLSVEQLM